MTIEKVHYTWTQIAKLAAESASPGSGGSLWPAKVHSIWWTSGARRERTQVAPASTGNSRAPVLSPPETWQA